MGRRAVTKRLTIADRVVKFIGNLTHTGDYHGQPFVLRPWQEDIVRRALGTLRADGQRQYRKVFLGLPRKQGKTEMAAALMLYLMLGTGKQGQKLYSASGDRAQASLIFSAAASMVRNDATLSKYCLVYDGYKKIVCERLESSYEALSSDAPRKHGLGPSVVLFDEVHVLPNRRMHDTLVTGFGARKEPLTIYITTAGWDRTSICWELWDYARKVRDGLVDDPTFLPILYEAEPDADWTDEAVWKQTMPALGDFCELEFIRDECRRARETTAYENTFRQLYLNQWTEQATRWLQVEPWLACGGLDTSTLDGRECYAGLDLGVSGDMSALAMVVANELGGYDLDLRYWVPREGKWRNEYRNKELYLAWQRAGWLTFTEGNTTDFDQVEREIVALNQRRPFKLLCADRAYARQILTRLNSTHEIPVVGIPQGPVTLNEPMVRFEALIVDGKIRHPHNPVLDWNIANAVMIKKPTGLMHLDKSGNTNRIDGLAAVLDALRVAIDTPGDPDIITDMPLWTT